MGSIVVAVVLVLVLVGKTIFAVFGLNHKRFIVVTLNVDVVVKTSF
jgi:hypothetical protein